MDKFDVGRVTSEGKWVFVNSNRRLPVALQRELMGRGYVYMAADPSSKPSLLEALKLVPKGMKTIVDAAILPEDVHDASLGVVLHVSPYKPIDTKAEQAEAGAPGEEKSHDDDGPAYAKFSTPQPGATSLFRALPRPVSGTTSRPGIPAARPVQGPAGTAGS